MPRRYSDDEILVILRDAERAGTRVLDVLAAHGVPERSFHNWRRRYGASTADGLRRIRELERRVHALERRERQLDAEKRTLQQLLGKPWRRSRPGARPSGGSSDRPG